MAKSACQKSGIMQFTNFSGGRDAALLRTVPTFRTVRQNIIPIFMFVGHRQNFLLAWQRRSVTVVVVNWNTGAHRATLHG
jgi:hypothetical protein